MWVFVVRGGGHGYIRRTLKYAAESGIESGAGTLRRRKWAAVGFAVAFAAPLLPISTLAGQAPATQPAGNSLIDAKTAYELGVRQYHAGDWASARKNLQIAAAAGYRPASIFQDSPSEILKRIDLRDRSAREHVQKLEAAPETQPDPGGPDPLAALRATDEARHIRHEQAVRQAQQWVQQANAARKSEKYDEALDLYRRAVELDPSNNAAIQGRDQVLSFLGRNPSPADLMNEAAHTIEARRGEIHYNVQSNLDQARAAIAQGNWSDAQIAIDRARLAASADPSIFTPKEIRSLTNSIDQTDLQLHQEQERQHERAEQSRDLEVQHRLEEQRKRAIEERQRTIADLVYTAKQLDGQGRYREALQTVDQILILDPINDFAVGVRPLLEDKTQFGEQRDFMERRDRAVARQLNNAEEKQIPYDDVLRYPVDWPDISATRDESVALERNANVGDRAIDAQLSRTIPQVQFDNVAFSDVIDFLRDVSGLNIFVNWKTLEAAGIEKTTPVTAKLRNVKFSKALDIILNDSVGGGQTKLGYTIDEGVITVSTADELAKNVVVRVYDIRDLILNVPNFNNAPNFSLEAAQNSGGSQGGGGGQQGVTQGGATNTLFSGSGTTQQQNVGPTRQELVDAITKLVEDTVSSDSWKDNGGSTGALRELEGQLIVTQTPENHRQLVALLEKLRQSRAIQISIEARFLTVQRNFMEDVGVDLNFLFNLNSSWSKNFGTIPVTTPNSSFVMNPTTGVQGSIGSGTTTPTGLTTSVAYLDDFSAQMMTRAVEASVNSTLVTAPRITLFNGQRAYVLVAIQRAYVSNLTPVVTTGASSFAPTVSIVQSGVVLDVQATVSADRKYVTMTLRPQLATLLDLASFTFQVGTNGGGFLGGGVGGVNGALNRRQNAPTGIIQEPELQITEVNTTASVPDGGTLLVGGQVLAGETEREIGAPGPSAIPVVNRLFTDRSVAKDEQILLILVKPTIIVQHEIEQKQFPLLTSKLNGS